MKRLLKIPPAALLALALMAFTMPGHSAARAFPVLASPANPTAAQAWEWPLRPQPADLRGAVLRDFDPPDKPWLSGHRGVDLRTTSDGAAVTAPASGVVSFVGIVVDRPVITIDHGAGFKSSFEPVSSSLTAGALVGPGDAIGSVNPGHCAGLPCVHWGVRKDGEYIDPLSFFLDLRPSVLLPVARSG